MMYHEPIDMITRMISVPLDTQSPCRHSASRPYGFSIVSLLTVGATGAGGAAGAAAGAAGSAGAGMAAGAAWSAGGAFCASACAKLDAGTASPATSITATAAAWRRMKWTIFDLLVEDEANAGRAGGMAR
jgi:hypothetical protein